MGDRNWFFVESRAFDVKEDMLEDGSGPSMPTRDFLLVRAMTAPRAALLFVRAMRRKAGDRAWRVSPWLVDGNPFAGLRVVRAMDLLSDRDPYAAPYRNAPLEVSHD